MKRNALKFTLVSATALISLIVALLMQRHAELRWREQQELLREQGRKVDEMLAENRRLTSFATQATNSFLAKEDFRELLRLRSEVGSLRQSAREAPALELAHRELLASAKKRELPDDRPALAYWPKTQLSQSGYSGPPAALQTALWAMSRNDANALLASVTPAARSALAKGCCTGDSPEEIIARAARNAADSMSLASGFYLVGQDLNGPDQAMLDVYFDQEGATRRFALSQVNGEWKLNGIYSTLDGAHAGPMIWP